MSKQKLNIAIGRFQPFTQGHLNMVNEGEAPCLVYRINSSNKAIERKNKGIKIGSKSWTDESVNKVIAYIDNPTGDLTEQEKELLKRPFTNELIDKELEEVKKTNKNIVDVIPVTHVYDALGRYNAFLTEHSDEYEVGDWMCGDDRKDDFEDNIEKMSKYTELETELKSGKTYPNILIEKLKVNTGKGRTAGVSGTAVRKAILNKDKAAFEKIMPKGAVSLFNDFTKAFDDFKAQLQNIIKEHKMLTLKEYILESEINQINEKLSFGDKLYYIGCKIMGLECVTQGKYIKEFKKFVENRSDNKVSIIIKTYKQIKNDLNNCLNKDEELSSHDWGKFNIEKGIKEGHWWNDITLEDNFPFVCYYNRSNKDKYILEPDSLWFIKQKDKNGNRNIMGGLWLDDDDPAKFGWAITNIRIPQALDYDKWLDDKNKQSEEEKKHEQENIKATIKRMEDELNKLKELVKNKD